MADPLTISGEKTPTKLPRNASEAAEIRCILKCPECGTEATVAWTHLSNLLRCKKCHTSFWIGRSGNFESDRDYDKVRYVCPRCGQPQQLVSKWRMSHVCCTNCRLDVALPESKTLPDAIKQLLDPNYVPPMTVEPKPWPRWAVWSFFAALLVVVPALGVGLACWGYVSHSLDPRLREAVRAFTVANSLGDRPTALSHIAPGQSTQYMKWAGLNNEFKASSPDVFDIRLSECVADVTWVELNLQVYDADDVHSQFQAWRKNRDGGWWFDAAATLERPARRSP